ncbi:hypothetical protein RYX36_025476 [Vicia faba]
MHGNNIMNGWRPPSYGYIPDDDSMTSLYDPIEAIKCTLACVTIAYYNDPNLDPDDNGNNFDFGLDDDFQWEKTLPDVMGEYLFNTSLCAINLVGPNSRSQLCELDVNTYSFVIRLSTGWSVFAAINEIGVGNQLQFNMCDMYDNHYGWVGKLI